jgi:hypothetical protein
MRPPSLGRPRSSLAPRASIVAPLVLAASWAACSSGSPGAAAGTVSGASSSAGVSGASASGASSSGTGGSTTSTAASTGGVGTAGTGGSGGGVGFSAPLVVEVGGPAEPAFILALGDFDGNGTTDVLVGTSDLLIYSNAGAKTFTQVVDRPVGDFETVDVADVNGDGKLDLLTAYDDALSSAGGADVILNQGGFQFAPSIVESCGSNNQHEAEFGDFDGDGKIDVLIASSEEDRCVLLGDGKGGFAAPLVTTDAYDLWPAAVGDLTGAHRSDLVFADGLDGIVVQLAAGAGAFQPSVLYGSGFVEAIVTADLDGDGHPDVAALNASTNAVDVYLNDGTGKLGAPHSTAALQTGSEAFRFAVGDIDGDGKLDLVAVDASGLLVLLGQGDGTFQPAKTFPSGVPGGFHAVGIALADMDGDKKLDVVIASAGVIGATSTFQVLYNTTL